MPKSYVNTFAAATPLGQSLQNIAAAMFGGKTPIERDMEEAKIDYAIAHGQQARSAAAASDALAGQRRAETVGTEQRNRMGSPEGQREIISRRSFIPVPTLDMISQHLVTGEPLNPAVTPEQIAAYRAIYPNVQLGFADKTVNPEGVEKGIHLARKDMGFVDALTNPARIVPFARAENAYQGQGENKSGTGGMVLNEFTGGVDVSNPMAQGTIASTKAQERQRNAAAAAHGAAAGAANARTALTNIQAQIAQNILDTGVRPGTQIVDNGDGTTSIVSNADAVAGGLAPGARPRAPGAGPRERQPDKLGEKEIMAIDRIIVGKFGVNAVKDIDPATYRQVFSLIRERVTDPANPFFRLPEQAVDAVMRDIQTENPMFGKARLREGSVLPPEQPRRIAPASPRPAPSPQPRPQPAPAGGQYPTATNPATGETLIFKDGKWQKPLS